MDQYLLWLAIDATTLDQHPWQLCSRANAQPVGSVVRQDYIALLKRHQANTSLSSLLSFKQEEEESRGLLGSLQASHWLRSQTLGGISAMEPLVAVVCSWPQRPRAAWVCGTRRPTCWSSRWWYAPVTL